MSDRSKRESMPLEEVTVSNMWEIAAIHCGSARTEGLVR
jgi:hypothetical protein